MISSVHKQTNYAMDLLLNRMTLCNASGIVLFRIINLTMKSIQAGTIEKIPGKIMVKPSQEIILVVRTTNVTACRGKFMCSL